MTFDNRYSTEIDEEKRQYRRAGELLDALVSECPWMWHLGDGDGGRILEMLFARAEASGLRPLSPAEE